jgi:hypothetical protein
MIKKNEWFLILVQELKQGGIPFLDIAYPLPAGLVTVKN